VSTHHPHIDAARDQKPRINEDPLKLRSMKRMDSHLLDRMPQASRRLTMTPVKIFSALSIPRKYAALSKDKSSFPLTTY
jgi:hypothetical protein